LEAADFLHRKTQKNCGFRQIFGNAKNTGSTALAVPKELKTLRPVSTTEQFSTERKKL